MKRFIVLCVLCFILAGCGGTSQERLDGLATFLGTVKEQSELIDEDIQVLKQTLTDLQTTAADPDLSPEDSAKITDTLVDVSEKLEQAIAAKVKVDKVIAQAEAEISRIAAEGNANIGDEIAAVGSVLMISSAELPPPIGVWVGIIGTLIGAVGGVIAKRAKAVSKELVAGVQEVKAQLPEQKAVVNAAMASKQTTDTKIAVAKLKAA